MVAFLDARALLRGNSARNYDRTRSGIAEIERIPRRSSRSRSPSSKSASIASVRPTSSTSWATRSSSPGSSARTSTGASRSCESSRIRNTALRFRFNVITQKFNTYSMYWTRICRQIEEGTYKRHVVRAAKRFGGKASTKREQDWSIEVELGDFDEVDDMGAILAEADAAAEAYGRGGLDADTIPPGAPADPPDAEPLARPAAPPVRRSPMTLPTPGTSFAMSGGRETVGSEPPSSEATPAPLRDSMARAARHAPLPPGARQPVLVRVARTTRRRRRRPPSRGEHHRSSPLAAGAPLAARPPAASHPDVPPAGPRSDRAIRPRARQSTRPRRRAPDGRPGPGSIRALPLAPPSSEGAPPSVRRIRGSGSPPSTGRLPTAAAPQSTGRIPTPASPLAVHGTRVPAAWLPPQSTGRIPTAAPPQSTGRIPVAARSSAGNIATPASPMTPPRTPASSQGRIPASSTQPAPYRPAALPPSANRLPVAQTAPSAPRMPTSPIARPAAPSAGRLPASPGSTPQRPSPSGLDSEQPRPSRRPPPPLPGQVNKKT